ncbi:CMRF35-like molecule 6 isoform X2 [Siniperca chuatsi]|uniref:CMRF35-like molecule 6 isoform X2 n=1 Tax=Siniperca chuatsi TaxID=119488 RepID=UPI001CE22504|nr:CMRF35-like molecule 6 isoform X2 [Siniperca chuatsi]
MMRNTCFKGALCDEEIGTPRYVQGTEGGSIRVGCSFQFVEIGRKFFCKEQCKGKDVLVQTIGSQAQNGRYSLKYTKDSLIVSITQLMKSDAGRYRCGVKRPVLPDSYKEFEVAVTDATTAFPETNQQPADFLLVLVVCVTVVVLLAVVLLLLYKKKRKDSDGSNKKGNSERTRTEIVPYENSPPVSTCKDSTYQSLDPASRDLDQIYCTLTQIQPK